MGGNVAVDWNAFREAMPVTRNWAYFDHAAVAPLPAPSRDALIGWSRQASEQGDAAWPEWAARVERVREMAAGMLAADPAEIALTANTTAGVNLVAEGFPWSDGDNVVTAANEFPTNRFPWLNLAGRGVETREVPAPEGRLDLDRLIDACDERTRLVTVSWVGYASGWRLDVDELVARAHRRGALVLLDAIQGVGVFPLDLSRTPVDFLAADGHKWMLGPEGAGLFFLRREHLSLLRPLGVGWNSVRRAHDFGHADFDLKDSAARYEGGSYNMAGLAALGASLDLLARFGLAPDRSAIAQRILRLTDHACRRLRDELGAVIHSHREGEGWSGIVSFSLPDQNPATLRRECLRRQVVVSCRDGRLRISPHAYNNEQDVDRLVEALRSARAGER
jgi:selenocysteine lyase/cysteine desulfurase